MQGSDLNKRAVENLIKCGAMDGLGMGRGHRLPLSCIALRLSWRNKRGISRKHMI